MKLYRVVVLRETKENIERGVWADKMEIQGLNILFFDTDKETGVDKLTAVYPVRYTIITNIETKEEYDKRKAGL